MRRESDKRVVWWIVEGVNPETSLLPGSDLLAKYSPSSGPGGEGENFGTVVKVIILSKEWGH